VSEIFTGNVIEKFSPGMQMDSLLEIISTGGRREGRENLSGYYHALYLLLKGQKQYDVYTTLKSLRWPIPHKEGCFGCFLGG
jgi:hypothetical protein